MIAFPAGDRNTFTRHVPHGLVRLLSALEALVLQALRCGEQGGIKFRHPNRAADCQHLASHRCQKRGTDVLEEVPAIRDLDRPRQDARDRATVAAVPVTGDHLDLRLPPQPCLDSRRLPIRQQVGDLPPLEVADHRAIRPRIY